MQSKITVVRVMAWVRKFGIIHSQCASERFSGKLNSIWGGMGVGEGYAVTPERLTANN